MISNTDKLHADAVCALGLLLHGNEKTDRGAAAKAAADGIDALGDAMRERDATIARLTAALRHLQERFADEDTVAELIISDALGAP